MSTWYVAGIPYSSDELYHHGIKGQKWGVRRFQNPDGTRTPAGKERYGYKNKDNYEDYKSDENRKILAEMASKFGNHEEREELVDKMLKTPQIKYAVSKLRDKANKYQKAMDEFDRFENDLYDNVDLNFRSINELKESGSPEAKQYIRLENKYNKTYDDLHVASKKYVDEFLGEYSNTPIEGATNTSWYGKNAGQAVGSVIINQTLYELYKRTHPNGG